MRCNNITNSTFTGYKNLITNSLENDDNSKVSFISMELTDDSKNNDLSRYKSILKELDAESNNIFSCVYIRENKDECLTFNNKLQMRLDNKAVEVIRDYMRENPQREVVFLKLCTFLADITSRISKDSNLLSDGNIYNVILSCVENFKHYITGNDYLLYQFIIQGQRDKNSLGKEASSINAKLQRAMAKYFSLK